MHVPWSHLSHRKAGALPFASPARSPAVLQINALLLYTILLRKGSPETPKPRKSSVSALWAISAGSLPAPARPGRRLPRCRRKALVRFFRPSAATAPVRFCRPMPPAPPPHPPPFSPPAAASRPADRDSKTFCISLLTILPACAILIKLKKISRGRAAGSSSGS